ncbi:glyoxylase-like metal-dependent hydrolase (beta-lactamase superfamily II) [Thermosporothrix hazakensis]|uniref:Glyoxylase-like metal-dependent hydrolase (Beta-lactamase superfamily II) n=1 Tax=Thermosporothrix hazakensis TaxID=644383 RepID=A0A326UVF0_THEHA|nr:MBL fold metallo-hydrolase [Thermosporothrix hazakensis]PZW36503.1 glyoxylase-like metal-dependent hydrolase (beta-lactamase superfamily II) [Thermosporothrix hazakensis]
MSRRCWPARRWLQLGAISLGVVGAGVIVKSFIPPTIELEGAESAPENWQRHNLPEIDISFFRCGSTQVPEWLLQQGVLSWRPRTIAHSAVLIRHPRATFLYDTGLCEAISIRFIAEQSPFFRRTLGRLTQEKSLSELLGGISLDFALLSHLHWDHVGGVPDIPGVPLRVSRIEYESLLQSRDNEKKELTLRLMQNNPVEVFDLEPGDIAGFSAAQDLFGDGSLLLISLPGHTPGNTGLLIQRSNGSPLFLVGDAGHIVENILGPTPLHPLFGSMVTTDKEQALDTLKRLYLFANAHPEIPLICMHDAQLQEKFMSSELARKERAV